MNQAIGQEVLPIPSHGAYSASLPRIPQINLDGYVHFISLEISFMASKVRIYFSEIPFPSPYFAKITR